jgi:ketosteroid isomerase-like protein
MTDKVEIQEAISLYHEAASTFDFELLAMAFLPDGIWEVPDMRIFSQGRDDIRTAMSDLMKPIEYLVQINAPAVIAVDGDTASARSLIRESAKFRNSPDLMDVVGRYVDELARTPDGWKFARRTFTIIGTHVSASAAPS